MGLETPTGGGGKGVGWATMVGEVGVVGVLTPSSSSDVSLRPQALQTMDTHVSISFRVSTAKKIRTKSNEIFWKIEKK